MTPCDWSWWRDGAVWLSVTQCDTGHELLLLEEAVSEAARRRYEGRPPAKFLHSGCSWLPAHPTMLSIAVFIRAATNLRRSFTITEKAFTYNNLLRHYAKCKGQKGRSALKIYANQTIMWFFVIVQLQTSRRFVSSSSVYTSNTSPDTAPADRSIQTWYYSIHWLLVFWIKQRWCDWICRCDELLNI